MILKPVTGAIRTFCCGINLKKTACGLQDRINGSKCDLSRNYRRVNHDERGLISVIRRKRWRAWFCLLYVI